MSPDKLLQLKREEILSLADKHGAYDVRIFGSVARGDADDESDIDILVVFDDHGKNFKNFLALIDFLEDRLGCSVDLVTRESLSPYLGPHILDEVEYVPLAS